MTQNRNFQFLNSEPQLAFYLNNLKESISAFTSKINHDKIQARELMFNISALFSVPLTRNKIDQQFTKIGITEPQELITNPEIDQIVQTVAKQHRINDVSTKIVISKEPKRGSSTVNSQDGLESKKKRKTEGEAKTWAVKQISKGGNLNSQESLPRDESLRQHEQVEKLPSSNSLQSKNNDQDSEFEKA